MFRFLCSSLILVTLAGCASIASQRQDLHKEYVGEPASLPIKAFGIPAREIQAAGLRAYQWEVGAGDCKMTMEVSPEEVIKDVRLSGYVESCESYVR